jgi:hypothetical protein
VNSAPYPCRLNQRSMVDRVSPGFTAYVIVDTTNEVDGGGGAGWVVEVVDASVPPVLGALRGAVLGGVTGARLVGGGFDAFALGGTVLARLGIVATTLLVGERVVTRAVPALRAMMPTANTEAASLGLIDFCRISR